MTRKKWFALTSSEMIIKSAEAGEPTAFRLLREAERLQLAALRTLNTAERKAAKAAMK